MPCVILLRHGHAGTKAAWHRADELRPLSPLGLAQARSVVSTLAHDEITTVWCSPAVRCQQTVEPLAAARGLHVRTSARLSRNAHPARLLTWLLEAGVGAPWVVCTHGEVITALHDTARRAGLVEVTARKTTPKGALWRLDPHPDRSDGPLGLSYTPPSPAR